MGYPGNFLDRLQKIDSKDSNQEPPKFVSYTSVVITYTVNCLAVSN
jgi:hypothetical protein